MSPLTIEAASALFDEYFGWFGPPALLTRPPSQFSFDPTVFGEQATYIIDGRTRFEALALRKRSAIWAAAPAFVFIGENLYSTEGRKLLPRMLALAGHNDRAAKYVPETWCGSPLDVAAYLRLSELQAHEVFAEIEILKRKLRRKVYNDRDYHCVRIVNKIRAGLLARLEGCEFELADVAKLVEFDGPLL